MTVKLITFGAGVLLLACSHDPPAPAAAATAAHASAEHGAAAHDGHTASSHGKTKGGHGDSKHGDSKHGDAKGGETDKANHLGGKSNKGTAGGKKTEVNGYAVPFVWETSKTDPLAIARGHLKEIVTDNAIYVKARTKPPVAGAVPRTTIVTCSDAEMQLNGLDATPEGDAYVARNWGNLLDSSLGSVAYGIEQLHTPVLLIVGHTECEAVKAAIEKPPLSRMAKAQIAKLKVHASEKADPDLGPVNDTVIYNIHRQVGKAVERFQPLVQTGALTVIGAVYDPHNVLEQGYGKLSIININTVTEPASMRAFITAVINDDKIVMHEADPPPEEAEDEHDDEERDEHDATEHSGNAHGAAEHAATEHAAEHAANHGAPRAPESHGTPRAPEKHSSSAHAGAHVVAVQTPKTSHEKAAEHAPASKAAPPRGLPQIDHLEASLVGEAHEAAPQPASHHADDEHGH